MACFFLVVVLGYGSLIFVDDGKSFGFKSNNHAAAMGYVGVVLFGTMLIGSVLIAATYFVLKLTLDAQVVRLRSLFRNCEFDMADVSQLKWKRTRRLRFTTPATSVSLDLRDFNRPDSLAIIREFRSMIAADKQVGWDVFCHHVAIPLRDNFPDTASAKRFPQPADPSYVLITRRRYDQFALVIIPLSLAVSVLLWWRRAWPEFVALPFMLFLFWLLLRFSTPINGCYIESLFKGKRNKYLLLGVSTIPLSVITIAVFRLSSFTKDQACSAGLVIAGVGLPLVIFGSFKSGKARRAHDAEQIPNSLKKWEEGEETSISNGA